MVQGVNLLKGNYILQNSNRGKACLLGNMPEHSNEVHSKKMAIVYAFLGIAFFRLLQFKFKVKRYIIGLCPYGRMACLGKFRRNVINLNQTFWWSLWWCFASTLCCISVDYGQGYISAKTQFWIWNISGFIGYEGPLLLLPFFLDVPGQSKVLSLNTEFYVRKPTLEPRIPDASLKKIKSNQSPLSYTKKPKINVGLSKNQVLSGKVWFVNNINELGTLSEMPRITDSFQGDKKKIGGLGKNSSQFHGVSGDAYLGSKDFEELLNPSRKSLGLPAVY